MAVTFEQAATLQGEGRLDEAAAAYEQLLKSEPSTEVRVNLGALYIRLGRPGAALEVLEKAITANPTFAEAHNNKGVALQSMGRIDDAVVLFETALSLRPDYADARINLGNALAALERFDEADHQFDRALQLHPDNASLYEKIAAAAKARGRLKRAAEVYEKGLAVDPERASLYRMLAAVKRLRPDDRYVVAMQRLATKSHNIPLDEQIELHFALAKVYLDNSEPERSIGELLEANALKRRFVTYDESSALARLNAIAAMFNAAGMRALAGSGSPSAVPVFIVGMPRSGTTLVEQMMASHRSVYGAGELETFNAAIHHTMAGPTALTPDLLRRLGERYVAEVTALAPIALRIIDKMPANFRHLGLIHLALPNARIIHVRRDPIDTCMSCFAQHFTGDQPFSYDLAELGRYYRAYQRLMDHWRSVLPGAMLEVRYEELVANFETQARRIVAFAGLPWDDACNSFHRTERSVRTASASQVRQPLYKTSIGRWEPYRELLRPLFDALEIA